MIGHYFSFIGTILDFHSGLTDLLPHIALRKVFPYI